MNQIWWLFCNVVDNLGDIGVSWRLARELRTRLNGRIYLFVDDISVLKQIVPDFADENRIVIKNWQAGEWADVQYVPPPDVVMELFACRLPENVLTVLKQHNAAWINWEYLSAESWAVQSHQMKSLQADGYAKYFWQMGFVPQSGGLLREQHFRLPEKRQYPISNHNTLKILVFAYESDIWAQTFAAWQQLGWRVQIDLFGNQVLNGLKKSGFLPPCALSEYGETWRLGSLILCRCDFVPQADFDDLLAQYDWLFVRGEDSFVRAQWAAKPFFWHIYQQDELAHLDKLNAFWQTAFAVEQGDWQAAHQALSQELNGGGVLTEAARLAHWQDLREHEQAWRDWVQIWHYYLINQNDTVSNLAIWLQQSAK